MRNPYTDELLRREALSPRPSVSSNEPILATDTSGIAGPGAYITNATSRSVAFYVMSFLNNQDLTEQQFVSLRRQLQTERASGRFNIDELKLCFLRQSAFFLELFTQRFLTGFKTFLRDLEVSGRFNSVFSRYQTAEQLLVDFQHRNIYHTNLECEYMRNDYVDESMSIPNTGVFGETTVKRGEYLISKEFLEHMQMRHCKDCAKLRTDK